MKLLKRNVLASLIAVSLLLASRAPLAQTKAEQLKEYSRTLAGEDVTLTFVHINDRTAPLLFQPPTLYSMRARAKESTTLYVQGRAERDIQIDTTNFKIEQSGASVTGTPSNIKNFERGNKVKIRLGEQIDGVLTFAKLFDPSKPFTLRHDKALVEFKFTEDQIKGMTVAPPAQ